jgi:hypothetical protein
MRRGDGPWGRGMRHEPPAADDAPAWIRGALPDSWYTGAPEITIDRDEIVIVGPLAEPPLDADASDADRSAARQGRVSAFREETREQRIRIAQQVEHRYRRRVAWGVTVGDHRALFTTHSAPVMTRLRQPERMVLDTLVDAGVARSRSEALAWCVALVGQHTDAWLTQLRDAMGAVEELRRQGPAVD